MILFLEDWGKYPNAIVHRATKNKSFLLLAEKLKRMGVANYDFFLALHDPTLEHVDPHDPYLDEETAAKVAIECHYNPWYFLREVARVPPKGSREPHMVKANRGIICLWWLFFNHCDVALVQPRQTGKSTACDLLLTYLLFVKCANTTVSLMTISDKRRQENIAAVKMYRIHLPFFLQHLRADDRDNFHEVTCRAHNNKLTTGVSQSSASNALSVGRGLTSAIQIIDETGYIDHIEDTLAGMLPGADAAREEAKKAGTPYGIMYTTTAGMRDTASGRYVYSLFHTAYGWSEKLYDCKNHAELYKVVRSGSDSSKFMVYACFSHRQLGFTDEWLRETMIQNNIYGERALRDYLNVWTAGGLMSPLTAELNKFIREGVCEPSYVEITYSGYTISWYLDKEELAERFSNTKVVLGMDTSDLLGHGRDATSLIFVDSRTLETIGTAKINETNILRMISFVCDLMEKYDNLILIPERRSTGTAVVDGVIERLVSKGSDPFKRIYNTLVDNHTVRKAEYDELANPVSRRPFSFYDKHKIDFGFATSGGGRHSRNALYGDALHIGTQKAAAAIRDRMIVDELTGLEIRNNRIDHAEGEHDDMVIGWLLALWFLLCSKNLKHYGLFSVADKAREWRPGIDADELRVKETDVLEELRTAEQGYIKDEMEELLISLREEKDDNIAMKIERRIKLLDGRLSDKYEQATTVDQLIEDARGTRSKMSNQRAREYRDRARNWAYQRTTRTTSPQRDYMQY